MNAITQRCDRRGSTAGGFKLLKCTIGLALVFGAPLVHSFDHKDSSQRSNIGHSRNGESKTRDLQVPEDTEFPTLMPTVMPTAMPTAMPTVDNPTLTEPTLPPVPTTTNQPSFAPETTTSNPTFKPTNLINPTFKPTTFINPTHNPTTSSNPTFKSATFSNPTDYPTYKPTQLPSLSTLPNPKPMPYDPSAQAAVSNANINNYCGKNYQDAYETCPLACPTGDDNDCLVLGEEYSCQEYTLCHERIKNGDVVPNTSGGDITPTPSPHDSTHIAFPACPPDYSLGSADYSLGSLVAFPIIGALKEVYECQGDFCNALPGPGSENGHLSWSNVGSCTDSTFTTVEPTPSVEPPLEPDKTVAPTAPTGGSSGATWYLRNDGVNTACVYGADYPEQFITNESLRERFIFESEEACCAKYPIICGGTDSTTTTPAPSSQPTTSPVAASSDPTSEPTSVMPTYQESEIATNSAFNMGQGVAFGVAMICVALLF